MNKELEEEYFIWLCDQVKHNDPIHRTYDRLFEMLHTNEFVWIVVGDKNRAADGMDLRIAFLRESSLSSDPDWAYSPCSLLEMFVAFSQAAEFQTDDPVPDWFWEFMTNLGLHEFYYESGMTEEQVLDIFETFIWRTYLSTGCGGGLFPLRNKIPKDQRKVELWYQLFHYLDDQDRML